MNIFVSLIPISSLSTNRLKYYSVVFDEISEDETRSIFFDFLDRMEKEEDHASDLNNLIIFLETMAKTYGARDHFFRPEQNKSELTALPPKPGKRHSQFIGTKLRLYTLRLNESVVILFNGGIKTTRIAQDCPNVKDHFKLANELARKIDDCLKEKEIEWNTDFTDIDYSKDLQISID